MATLQIHNIIDAGARIKHFDDFSVISLSINTQGKYQKANSSENIELFFDNPDQLQAFIYSLTNAKNQLAGA